MNEWVVAGYGSVGLGTEAHSSIGQAAALGLAKAGADAVRRTRAAPMAAP